MLLSGFLSLQYILSSSLQLQGSSDRRDRVPRNLRPRRPMASWDFGDFDWVLSVLLCGRLALVALANDLFYHAVHCREPLLFSQHLFDFGYLQMSLVVCCPNHLSLETCGYENPISPEIKSSTMQSS